MKTILVLLTLLCCNGSCAYEKHISDPIDDSIFPDSLLQHFPSRDINTITTSNVLSAFEIKPKHVFNLNYILQYKLINEDPCNVLKNKFSKESKLVLQPNDTNILSIMHYHNVDTTTKGMVVKNLESYHKRKLAKKNLKKEKGIPIPLFERWHFDYDSVFLDKVIDYTPSNLNMNFELYLLGAEPGKFLDDKYLDDCPECLPEEWQHGYTRGVAINCELGIVIYWLMVW